MPVAQPPVLRGEECREEQNGPHPGGVLARQTGRTSLVVMVVPEESLSKIEHSISVLSDTNLRDN